MEAALDTDEGDEQLRLAIALSLQDQSGNGLTAAVADAIDLTTENNSKHANPAFLGLDRKAMEKERLARKRKAGAPISPPLPAKTQKTSDAHLATRHLAPLNTADQTADSRVIAKVPDRRQLSGLRFPTGSVRKTWAYGFPRDEDIKLEEVLEPKDLTLAVLSSFQWDVEWLIGKLDTAKTKIVMVMQAKDESTKQQYARETADMPHLRLCFPSMAGQINCMHSKLMLLAHPSYLRVAVPTANLVPYDWGESGVMENTVFVIDLPRKDNGARCSADDLTFFGKELIYFCKAMGLQPEVVDSLYNFDFSATREIAFVHTIGGAHTGESDPWRRTGYCGLGRAVTELGLGTAQPLKIDFIASSIGAINIDFLIMLYLAAQGNDGLREYDWRIKICTKAGRKRDSSWRTELIQTIWDNFRLYFPSRDTVLASRGGADCGGPICFQPRWYNADAFPQQIMRDCKSVREGLLMHNKASASTMMTEYLLRSLRYCMCDRRLIEASKISPTPVATGHISGLQIARRVPGASLCKTDVVKHLS